MVEPDEGLGIYEVAQPADLVDVVVHVVLERPGGVDDLLRCACQEPWQVLLPADDALVLLYDPSGDTPVRCEETAHRGIDVWVRLGFGIRARYDAQNWLNDRILCCAQTMAAHFSGGLCRRQVST